MEKLFCALVPSVFILSSTLKQRERCSARTFVRAVILLAIPFSAQAIPVDPSLAGAQTLWSTECFTLREAQVLIEEIQNQPKAA